MKGNMVVSNLRRRVAAPRVALLLLTFSCTVAPQAQTQPYESEGGDFILVPAAIASR